MFMLASILLSAFTEDCKLKNLYVRVGDLICLLCVNYVNLVISKTLM